MTDKADSQYPDFEQSFIFEDPKPAPVYPDPFYKDPEFAALEKVTQDENYCGGTLPQDWGLDDRDDALEDLIDNLQPVR